MKSKRILMWAILIAVALVLAGAVGMALAQEPEGDDDVLPQGDVGTAALLNDVIPIQGRLLDASGNPINGTRTVVYTLYDASTGGNALCTDTDGVTAVNGLFNGEMDNCAANDLNGRKVWLGIKVGGDAEMTPRQEIFAVPYAWSLRPGAVISESLGGAIIHAENTNPTGRGLRGYATATTGENYGVVGASTSPDGYGGYFYNNGSGTGLYGSSDGTGLSSPGVLAKATGTGGIALHATAVSTDTAIVIANGGTGPLLKGFGAGGGEDELRINNDGSIETKADSYIWIPGNMLRQYQSDNAAQPVVMESWLSGAMEVRLSGGAGTRIVDLPIQIPGTLYGQGVKVEQVIVYYQCTNAASFVDRTVLHRYAGTQSSVILVDDNSDRAGTAQTSSYTLTPTVNNTFGSGYGILNLRFFLHFTDAAHSIFIGGVRVRLGHHDLY